MKRRHPMQIMDAAKLVSGDVYAVAMCYRGDNSDTLDLYEQRCLAVVSDTEHLLKKRGRWRGPACCDEEYALNDLLDAQQAFDTTLAISPTIKHDNANSTLTPFTVHLDGWKPDEPKSSIPVILDWELSDGEIECDWDFDQDCESEHTVVVPVAAWLSDPRIHVMDWVNPDDAVTPLGTILSSEEAARKKTDDNLRRIFG